MEGDSHGGPFAVCANDQKPVPVDGLGTAISETGPEGSKLFFCCEACRQQWLASRDTKVAEDQHEIHA